MRNLNLLNDVRRGRDRDCDSWAREGFDVRPCQHAHVRPAGRHEWGDDSSIAGVSKAHSLDGIHSHSAINQVPTASGVCGHLGDRISLSWDSNQSIKPLESENGVITAVVPLRMKQTYIQTHGLVLPLSIGFCVS